MAKKSRKRGQWVRLVRLIDSLPDAKTRLFIEDNGAD